MVTGAVLAQQARHYIGTPFYHCGRNEHGLDCCGLLIRVAHDLGMTDWDEVDYSQQVNTEYLRESIDKFCDPVPKKNMRAGDILLFSMMGSPQHLGIVTDLGFIHAHQTAGGVVENSLDSIWLRRLVAVYRWRGIDG